ncbi:MAG: hypothetical protein F6K56_11460 [Moorea sp. SIO3G5]|nr:hypothetical protein [Moorena sp. SIO3G5]
MLYSVFHNYKLSRYTGFFPYSLFPVPCSLFPTPYSLLPTPYSRPVFYKTFQNML